LKGQRGEKRRREREGERRRRRREKGRKDGGVEMRRRT
jgi:hypothetical protein